MKKLICFLPHTRQLWLFTLLGFLVFFLIPLNLRAEEKSVGLVIAVSGTIEYRTGTIPAVASKRTPQIQKVSFTPWNKVEFRQQVYASDEFRTARSSRLKVKFADNSLLALGPNSSVKVESYIYDPSKKLRRATINVAKGLAMYIINKSQKNKKSEFKMVSPVGNIASRGTHGYVGVFPEKTIVANQAGAVETSNNDPNVVGQQIVGPMQKNQIREGQPPTPATDLTRTEVNAIRNQVIGRIGVSSQTGTGNKPLVKVEENAEEEESEESKESGKENSSETNSNSEEKSKTGEGKSSDSGNTEGGSDTNNFDITADIASSGDFAEINDPFDSGILSSCSQ
jgi:hypothetical protein